jgi:Flp pilus assembly protein CpaB
MRVRQTAYLVVFVVASLVAAGAYWLAQPRTEVVRATVDVPVFTQLTPDMIEVVRVSPVGVPTNAARSPDAVVGMYAALPILAGQDVDARALEAIPGSQAFGFGAPIGPGQVAFALPVTAEQAVGGALRPGALVDVIAVPARTSAAGDGAAAEPVVLGQGLVVLALRSTDGQDMATGGTDGGTSPIPPKLGSVVVAIPAARLAEFASAVETMTVFIGLVPAPTVG